MRFRLIWKGERGRILTGWYNGDPLPLLKMFWPCGLEIAR